MKVGVVGPVRPDNFAENIAAGLTALGVQVHPLGTAQPRSRNAVVAHAVNTAYLAFDSVSRQIQRGILSRAKDLNLDVVITVDATLNPSVVADLKAGGTKVCLWYPDSLANLDRYWAALTAFDAMFFKEPMLVRRLSQILELPTHYLPQACNPNWHRVPDETFDEEAAQARGHVVVAGNIYGTRAKLLSLLLDEGLPLRIFGAPLSRHVTDRRIIAAHTGKYLSRVGKARVFRQALTVLNSMHPSEIEGVNSRLFEATGSGAAVVTEYREQLPNLYTPDTEVLAFATVRELIGHVKTLSDDPDFGRRLGDAAAQRAHAEHTYPHRVAKLLEVVV